MTPFAFDTLSASKQLREAGMEQGVAEAVVAVFQHAASPLDISHPATKDDVEALRIATKQGLETLADTTKGDLEALRVAAKADVEVMEARLRTEIVGSEARLRETIRMQGWALIGGMGIMLAVFGGVSGFLN